VGGRLDDAAGFGRRDRCLGTLIAANSKLTVAAAAAWAPRSSGRDTGRSRLRPMIIALLFALVCPTYAQQSGTQQQPDYRLAESTQACDRRNSVPASVERAKHGVGLFKLGCAPVVKGHKVRLTKQKGDESLVELFTPAGCNHRWVLSNMLTKIDR